MYTALDSSSSKSCSGLKTFKKTYITAEKQVVNETLTDWKENVIYEKTNGEVKRTNAYYANGQLARQTDALDNTIKYENTVVEVNDTLRKVSKTYTPFNGKEKYSVTENQYDKNGNIILTKQTVQKEDSGTAKYSITQNEYNGLGLLSKVTLSGTGSNEKNITQYFYNHDGIQTEMRTGLSSDNDTSYLKTEYIYDSHNRLVRTKDSTDYNSGTITYDLSGNVLTSTDANGNITTNTYDALNRVLTSNTVNPSDSSKNVSKSYTYDSMGRITETVSNALTTSTIYDSLGRKYTESEYNNDGYVVFRGYFYEGISQYVKEELTGQAHLLLYSDKTYEYDGEMRVVKVKESGKDTASYAYDKNGNKKSETLANGVVSTYTYNNNNKVTEITNKKGNSTISSYEYSYYLDGSDACKVRNESGIIESTSYEYDSLKRLTKESVKVGNNTTDTYTYEYDDYGNRSKMTATGTEDYVTEYSYNNAQGKYTALLQKETKTVKNDGKNPLDKNDKVEQTVYTYDKNGNQVKKVANGKTETNTYDGLNQLIGFTDGDTTASYAYNVDGLRYKKTVDGQTINHVWDGGKQIVADVIDNQFYEADCYIRGTNLVAKYNYRNGNKSEYTYYTQNAHGDVVNLTDKDGKVTKKYTYDAFGVEKNIDNNDTNAFRYCGEYYDTETGTIYLRARYYDPETGRFISRDSFAGKNEDPLSLNLYTYCHNNPTINVDPSGHFILTAILIGAAIGAAVSGGVSLYKEAKSAGSISNMTSDNWKNVGMSTVVGGICGGVGGGFGALGASAAGSLITSSAASPLIASATTSSFGYAVGTGMAGGMAGSCASTITQQALYGYSDPYEIMHNTAMGGITGGAFGAAGYGISRFAPNTRSFLQRKQIGLNDVLENPKNFAKTTPTKLYDSLKKEGYGPRPLNRGSLKGIPFEDGGGYKVNFGGNGVLQYHSTGAHHGGSPYYKISTSKTGINRYDIYGNPRE